jgi:hypothetical protein
MEVQNLSLQQKKQLERLIEERKQKTVSRKFATLKNGQLKKGYYQARNGSVYYAKELIKELNF